MRRLSRVTVMKLALSAVLLTATACLASWWLLWSEDPLIGADVSGFPVRGADISAHNGDVDFRLLRDNGGIGFVLIKATEGAQWQDRNFRRNFHRARRAGLKVGAYHFFRFDVDPELQALNVIDALRGLEPDLPVAIDVEEWTNPVGIPHDTVAARVVAMAETLGRRGIRTLVYTNKKGYSRIISKIPPEKTLDLWLCSLSTDVPEHPFVIWQYTHRGKIEGLEGRFDLNVFAGDSAGWRTWLRASPFRTDDRLN